MALTPDYRIEGCTTQDGPAIGIHNYTSFANVSWWAVNWFHRTPEQMKESFVARTPKALLTDRAVRRHQKVVHVPTGEIVGYARWILGEPLKDEWLEAQVPDVGDEERERLQKQHSAAFFTPADGKPDTDGHIPVWRERFSPKEPHLDLDYLCCHPDHRRNGVGSLLVQSGTRQADKLKIDVCLVAMGDDARGLYLKYGFEQVAEDHQDLRPFAEDMYDTYWLVRRHREE